MKTIQEIREAFGRSGAAILNGHHDALAEIAAEREPEEGRYLDRLPAEERTRLMREQKTERARESRDADHPLGVAAAESPDPEWSRSFYSAAWTAIVGPVEDLSE